MKVWTERLRASLILVIHTVIMMGLVISTWTFFVNTTTITHAARYTKYIDKGNISPDYTRPGEVSVPCPLVPSQYGSLTFTEVNRMIRNSRCWEDV